MTIVIYFIVALVNVFLHVFKNILVIKSTKFRASLANCICYTFAAVVIKFIAEVDLWIAIAVQSCDYGLQDGAAPVGEYCRKDGKKLRNVKGGKQ